MLIGAFIKNYKIYKGEIFIPFFVDYPEKLNLFIGDNGVGKSSILEAIDSVFNNGEWTINIESNPLDVHVGLLILYPKVKLNKLVTEREKNIVKLISDFLWNSSYTEQKTYEQIEPFFQYKNKIKAKYEPTHYIFIIGQKYSDPNPFFINFHVPIKGQITQLLQDSLEERERDELIKIIQKKIKRIYSYLYIPVETSIPEFLKLEAKGMQALMSKNIKQNIDEILTRKEFFDEETPDTKYSILDYVNNNLNTFVLNIEKSIQTIDPGYDFKPRKGRNGKMSSYDIRDSLIESYFSKRKLRKDRKVVDKLSSGERKKALINIAYSFLGNTGDKEKEIILAIDEPESSLHISTLYEQFERIDEMANKFGHQVFVTTHWYGSLPIVKNGVLQHIKTYNNNGGECTPKIQGFHFENYFEERGSHPEDIHLKSFFDLTASIVSALKTTNLHWILVEGVDDKEYLEYYLDKKIKVKILPVGGSAIVALIYQYLFLPISQKSDNGNLKGKVFCLIDTDEQGVRLTLPSETKNNKLRIRRLQKHSSQDSTFIKLEKIESAMRTPTEMEEALDPMRFFRTINEAIKKSNQKEIKEAWKYFKFDMDESIKCSMIKGDDSIIIFRTSKEATKFRRPYKKRIIDFVNNNKREISKIYINLPKIEGTAREEKKPNWINDIEKFFVD